MCLRSICYCVPSSSWRGSLPEARPHPRIGRMGALRKEERAAIAAVARHFSASWEEGGGLPDAYVTIAGKRIAAEIAAIGRRRAERGGLCQAALAVRQGRAAAHRPPAAGVAGGGP